MIVRAKIARGVSINRYLEPSHLMVMSGMGALNAQKESIQKFMPVRQSQIASPVDLAATMIVKGGGRFIMTVHAIRVRGVGMPKTNMGTQPYLNVFCVVPEHTKTMWQLSSPLRIIVKTVQREDTLTTRELHPDMETGT